MNLSFNKLSCLAVIGLFISLVVSENAVARSFTVNCKVGNGRSSIAIRGTGFTRSYYVLLFSAGDGDTFKSEPKTASKKGVLDFRFDSDPVYLAEHPDAFEIAPAFIKKREIAVVLRDAETNGHMGGIRTKCKKYRVAQSIAAPVAPPK
jgi:hypothetical protein